MDLWARITEPEFSPLELGFKEKCPRHSAFSGNSVALALNPKIQACRCCGHKGERRARPFVGHVGTTKVC